MAVTKKPTKAQDAKALAARKAKIASLRARKKATTPVKVDDKPKNANQKIAQERKAALEAAALIKGRHGLDFIYTIDVFDAILDRVACGESVASICREESTPNKSTFFKWLYYDKTLSDRYEVAKNISAYVDEDDLLDIADNSANDYMTKQGKDGETYDVLNPENIARSRVRVDTRKWLLERKATKRFNLNSINVNHGVQPDNPLADLLRALSPNVIKPVIEG